MYQVTVNFRITVYYQFVIVIRKLEYQAIVGQRLTLNDCGSFWSQCYQVL